MGSFDYKSYSRSLKQDADVVPRAVATIRRTVKLHAPRIARAEVQSLRPRQPVDRGSYNRSFRVDDIDGGCVFYNFSTHAPMIEDGRRAGARMPPLDVIFEWVKRKRIGATLIGPVQPIHGPRQKGARNISARGDAVQRQQLHIAMQIARKIKARGIPGHMIVSITSTKVDAILRQEIERDLRFEER